MYYLRFRSRIDRQPCIMVLTSNSANRKTGRMVQSWIMREDVNPWIACETGADYSVCGECGLKRSERDACYVQVWKAPTNVWKAYARRSYEEWVGNLEQISRLTCEEIRFGSYGDPCAVPTVLWRCLLAVLQPRVVTGYTHQWRNGRNKVYREWCMASVETPEERREAKRKGWRTFRVLDEYSMRLPGEITCPASVDGSDVQCSTCGYCNGSSRPESLDVAIDAHGRGRKRVHATGGGKHNGKLASV